MSQIVFRAPEYDAAGAFHQTEYRFEGTPERGWRVARDGASQLELGPGFVPLQTRCCGVCSTDLARRHLPYPLPQIIGHEVVAERNGKPVVVEINASHTARGHQIEACPFCASGLASHCPERVTLGIDRLPGGFSPWLLAPERAILEIPETVDPLAAVLTEPLAAAMQGVRVTPPRPGDRVAVLGPRRLGALTIAALAGYRRATGLDVHITALTRHDHLADLARALGADQTKDPGLAGLELEFDIVFDTTGSPDGFARAIDLAKRAVHLKSTHGRAVMGLDHLGDLVVDELAIMPCRPESLDFSWPDEDGRDNANVYVGTEVARESFRVLSVIEPHAYHGMPLAHAWNYLHYPSDLTRGSLLPRFDLAVAGSMAEMDAIIRPSQDATESIVRPRGAIMLVTDEANPLAEAVCRRGLEIHGSRCGAFAPALALLADNPDLAATLRERMITQRLPLSEIDRAFTLAADSRESIKVVVDTH